MTSRTLPKMVIIDGNSLLYRAFYALPLLQNSSGEYTNAVYGFTGMLFKLLKEEKPDYVAVAFDPPKPSFRVRIDQNYKAQREKTPPELSEQVQRVRQILEAMNISVFEIADYEADDVIGTLADQYAKQDHHVVVVSGDADLLQLVDDQINVMLTKKGISQMDKYDRAYLKDQFGLDPEQVIDYKALKGDPSDNIPGVPGIGDKTARSLIEKYGSIEEIYANLDQLKSKTAANLQEYRQQLETGRKLVTLCRSIPLEYNPENCRYMEPDSDRLINLFKELGFKRFIEKVVPAVNEYSTAKAGDLKADQLTTIEELAVLFDQLQEGDRLALLIEHEGGRPYWKQPVNRMAFAVNAEKGYFITQEHYSQFEGAIWKKIVDAADRDVMIITDNLKLICHHILDKNLGSLQNIFDTRIAAYLVEPTQGNYDLQQILELYTGYMPLTLKKRKGEPEDQSLHGKILGNQSRLLFELEQLLTDKLEELKLESLYRDLEMPLAAVLAQMERYGINVDIDILQRIATEISSRLAELERKIFDSAGEEFNINSPQQLATILFDKLSLPEIRKTKTGRSTDARVLEELAVDHEIASFLLQYRQLSKLEGTYLSGLIEVVDLQDHKIYTTFNQTVTATGRLSSSDPNLQNIPIRLEEGRRIRGAFVPSDRNAVFLSADYSQIELRILAHLSEDQILVEAFKNGEDIHQRTAAEVNSVQLDEVTPLMREKAKAVNFGIIYGSSDFGLARGLKILRAEAKQYIDSYFERYHGVKEYMDQITEQARRQGYVTTLLNRRRFLPEIRSTNHNTRSFAERMALNTPIQGSAADVIKLAMLKIARMINEGGFKAKMLLQIHDELLFEIDQSELNFFASLVKNEMEQAMALRVPLQVDLKWGCNWEELKKID